MSNHKTKRARNDLDEQFIDFIVKEMKVEIERLPKEKKEAWLEAQNKCRAEEFGDERLMQFLRCKGLNPKYAAQRFVNYWEARQQLFGPEKYFQCMSLCEALRDDVAALEAGVYHLLPGPDLSGQPLLYSNFSCNTGTDYTTESLVRSSVGCCARMCDSLFL